MTAEKDDKKPIFQRSYETVLLIDTITQILEGRDDDRRFDIIPYELLQKACGFSLQSGPGRGRLQTAKNHFLAQGMRLEVVFGSGIKLLTSSECLEAAVSGRDRIYKASKRERRRFVHSLPNLDALTNEEKSEYNASRAMFEILAHASRPKAYKLLEKKTDEAKKMLSLQSALTALQNGE